MIEFRQKVFNEETEEVLKKKLRRGCGKVAKPITVIPSNLSRSIKGLPRKRSYNDLRELAAKKASVSNALYDFATNPARSGLSTVGGIVETTGKEPLKGTATIGTLIASKGTAPTIATSAAVNKVIESNPVTRGINTAINNTIGRGTRPLVEYAQPQKHLTNVGTGVDRSLKKGVRWILKRI